MRMPKQELQDQDVCTRLFHKAHNAINNLDPEERDKIENMLIEDYSNRVTKITDEEILSEAMEKGVIL